MFTFGWNSPKHLQVWLKNLVGQRSLSSTFLRLYGPPQGLESTRTSLQFPWPDRTPHTSLGLEPTGGQQRLDKMASTVAQARGNWASVVRVKPRNSSTHNTLTSISGSHSRAGFQSRSLSTTLLHCLRRSK